MSFSFLCKVEVVGKVDDPGGIGFVEGNAAFVGKGRHGVNQRYKAPQSFPMRRRFSSATASQPAS